jgi:hypothetical protein
VSDRRPLAFDSTVATGKGDDGTTGLLFGGDRVAKDDPRTEAYGTIDEAVAALGLARAELGQGRPTTTPVRPRAIADLVSGSSVTVRRPPSSPRSLAPGAASRRAHAGGPGDGRRGRLVLAELEAGVEMPRGSSSPARPGPAPRSSWRAPSSVAPNAGPSPCTGQARSRRIAGPALPQPRRRPAVGARPRRRAGGGPPRAAGDACWTRPLGFRHPTARAVGQPNAWRRFAR